MSRIAVVGASVAGVAAVDAARSAGFDGELHLYDAQLRTPYDRPPLSKGLLTGAQTLDEIALKTARQWQELADELRLGRPVIALESPRTLVTPSGAEAYDGVVLAPGTRPRSLPFPVSPAVRSHVLRTTDDSLALRQAVLDSTSVVTVGGGFIGLEVASALRKLGRDCTVVESAALPLARMVGDEVARFVVDRHRAAGCGFRTGVEVLWVDEAVGGGALVALSDGSRLQADLVVLCIGVEPAIGFLTGSDVRLDNGIRTDGFGRTSVACVYACGDAANAYSCLYQRHLRIEHWTTAREQGALAGANLAADLTGRERSPFLHVPYLWSHQLDLKLQLVGRHVDGATVDVEHRDGGSLAVAFRVDGVLVGAAAVNRPRDLARFRQALHSHLTPPLAVPMALPDASNRGSS